jgi:hypothetical protein
MPSCHLGLSAHSLSLSSRHGPAGLLFLLSLRLLRLSLSYRSKHVGILFAWAGHSALGLAILTSFLIRLCVQLWLQ